jgi:hypothetical protein
LFIECLFRSFLLQFFNYLHKYWKNTIHFSDLTQEPLFYIKIHWNLGIELKTVSGLTYTHRKLTRNSIISKKANFWKIPIKLNKRIDAFFFNWRPYANEENGLILPSVCSAYMTYSHFQDQSVNISDTCTIQYIDMYSKFVQEKRCRTILSNNESDRIVTWQ